MRKCSTNKLGISVNRFFISLLLGIIILYAMRCDSTQGQIKDNWLVVGDTIVLKRQKAEYDTLRFMGRQIIYDIEYILKIYDSGYFLEGILLLMILDLKNKVDSLNKECVKYENFKKINPSEMEYGHRDKFYFAPQ